MRITTYHCERGEERDLQSRSVPSACISAGDRIGTFLTQVGISESDSAWAFATCQIQVMGKDAHNDKGTALRSEKSTIRQHGQQRWVHTKLETRGALPSSQFRRQGNGRFAWSDSFAGADDILGCFGMSMSDVLDYFGNVGEEERKIFDLLTIVRALAPELLQTGSRRVA